jgi:hypothetical protein
MYRKQSEWQDSMKTGKDQRESGLPTVGTERWNATGLNHHRVTELPGDDLFGLQAAFFRREQSVSSVISGSSMRLRSMTFQKMNRTLLSLRSCKYWQSWIYLIYIVVFALSIAIKGALHCKDTNIIIDMINQ